MRRALFRIAGVVGMMGVASCSSADPLRPVHERVQALLVAKIPVDEGSSRLS